MRRSPSVVAPLALFMLVAACSGSPTGEIPNSGGDGGSASPGAGDGSAAPLPSEPAPEDGAAPPDDASIEEDASAAEDAAKGDAGCVPQPQVCPTGWTYTNDGKQHRCSLFFTAPEGTSEYCLYSGMGYLGYSFPLPKGEYKCPTGGRYAPSTVGYCLWEKVAVPPGAVVDCDAAAAGRLEFRWGC